MIKRFLSLALLLAAAGAALAADPTATPGIDREAQLQQKRIQQGIASGQLTQREAARLEREQKRIAAEEARAKADGKVTPQERARIKRHQAKASKDIYREKHDAQRN